MTRPPTHYESALEARFHFAETTFPGGIEGWNSRLCSATGRSDGEPYLLRLFKKTGTALDDDLRRLVTRGLRRVRRVLSSRRARSLLVEIVEIVEDDDELGILMIDPGSPICGSSHRVRARHDRLLTAPGRQVFWRNISRIAEGLSLCHDAGIVHGAISEQEIFSQSDDKLDFRLGGYEACVHIADNDLGSTQHLLRSAGAVSFRQDWSDLGRSAARILGITDDGGGPTLLPIERRMLSRLINPPQYQLFDGTIVRSELGDVVADLARSGSSTEGELVLYPSPHVIKGDFSALTSGTISAEDRDGLLRFVEEDLNGVAVRALVVQQNFVRLVTDLATYGVKIIDDRVAMIENAAKKRPDDLIFDAVEIPHRIYLARSRKAAGERVLKLGPGAKPWIEVKSEHPKDLQNEDLPVWHALILLEAFTWLREQFRFYPVEVLDPSGAGDADLSWIVPRKDTDRDARREMMGLLPAAEALRRELQYDDGKANWTLSRADTLAGDHERSPDLSYEGAGELNGRTVYTFTSNKPALPGRRLFLRPRRDSGFESAIRRRLQNIVSARTNVELLRAIDDPAQIALDDALRDIAAPGSPPAKMDDSKKRAWKAIASGKSINVVVGPPGVGKTYLIAHLVKSILDKTLDARILISAQNHETLIQIEDELRRTLVNRTKIVVRVERTGIDEEKSELRQRTLDLLRSAETTTGHVAKTTMVTQRQQIKQALTPIEAIDKLVADRVFRDTDNLLLRSSDVTLATTSSHIIEEMIADGEQFDWVIVEEAARANGSELIGSLLLGNRRMLVGDHNQLSPFDAAQRQKFYDKTRAVELLRTAKQQLETISDLPPEALVALSHVASHETSMTEILAAAARLEEAFRTIAERESEREKQTGQPSAIVNVLLEQNRMHPAIGELVSNIFYDRKLMSSERVKARPLTVTATKPYLAAPVVILNFPPLSLTRRKSFEVKVHRSYRNELEAEALIAALKDLKPAIDSDGRRPTLALLSPYLAQVSYFRHLLRGEIAKDKTLFGFASARSDGEFFVTSDSFQGGEADVVVASLTRNNVTGGSRALGFLKSSQRLNVLLSRAKQKLILATSLRFIGDVVEGIDPDGNNDAYDFLRKMLTELENLKAAGLENAAEGATIVPVDECGRFPA